MADAVPSPLSDMVAYNGGRPLEPSAYLDSLWFDSLVYEPGILAALVRSAGAGHVVVGTDYPFDMGVTDPLARLDAVGLRADERDAIAGLTAARLLGL